MVFCEQAFGHKQILELFVALKSRALNSKEGGGELTYKESESMPETLYAWANAIVMVYLWHSANINEHKIGVKFVNVYTQISKQVRVLGTVFSIFINVA